MIVKDILEIPTNCKKIICESNKLNIVVSEWSDPETWKDKSLSYESYSVQSIIVEPLSCGVDINMYIII